MLHAVKGTVRCSTPATPRPRQVVCLLDAESRDPCRNVYQLCLQCTLCLQYFRLSFAAAQALYSWFQYELCDVFIELVKPVITRSSSEEGADADKQAFRETLWICLDTGLRCCALPKSVS